MTNIIIPLIFAIALVVIVYTLACEHSERKRLNAINQWLDEKKRYQIEAKVMDTIKQRAEWWDNFNIELYVKILEKK